MQDSDDYFDDDLVLDESTLAVLDEEEQKYNESQRLTQRAQSLAHLPPPAKRQKLFHGEASRTVSHSAFEDLPDVSVYGNGAYDLNSLASGGNHGSRKQVPQNTARARELPQRAHTPRYGSPVLNQLPGPQRQASHHRHATTSRQAGAAQETRSTPPAREADRPNLAEQQLRAELESLRTQVQQLSEAQEQARQALKAEREVVSSKAGEVANLRRNAEKSAKEHAAEVARIKAAKEAAEATQAQIRKEMKEEMERLRTQFTFKQHEIETSLRRPPWSAKPKNTGFLGPSTPTPIPSQMDQWSARGEGAGPSNEPQTPSRRHGLASKGSPSRAKSKLVPRDSPKKDSMLPGFVNAFAASQPRRPEQGKGKERAREVHEMDMYTQPVLSSPPPARPSPPSSPILASRHHGDTSIFDADDAANPFASPENQFQPPALSEDAEMADAKADRPADEYEEFTPPDRAAEIQRVIFTHRLPPAENLTFHLLLSTPLPEVASAEQRIAYASLCDEVLERLGDTVSSVAGMDYFSERLSERFVKMARILADVQAMPVLAALLALLRVLTLRLYTFSSTLLSHKPEIGSDEEAPPPIVSVCCDVIRTCLHARKEPLSEGATSLAQETLAFLEMLAWCAPEDVAVKLSFIPRAPGVFTALLAIAQPTWLLHLSARLLACLASHHSLFRHLLSYPHSAHAESMQGDPKKIPHIEQLSFYLTDTSREGADADALRESILRFVAGLLAADPDARTPLQESQTLVPSIVFYINTLATPLYEEDSELLTAPVALTQTCEHINRAVSLLHKLVCGGGAPVSVRHKLNTVPYRQFYGVLQMFVVSLGRLSYADLPAELDDAQRAALEDVMDAARELLELVVDGPDLEIIWSAFQVDEGMEAAPREEDEEEKEAQMLHSDDME